jgi:transcriptional regulator with PAS, ATPase and Fis domain
LCGKRIEEAFNASLEDMIARSIRGSFHPVTVYSAKANSRFFLTAQTPRDAANSSRRILMNDPISRDFSPASRAKALKKDARETTGRLDKLAHLEFGDPRMASQIQLAARVIQRKIPIILRGQTGTGKEVFANALHSISPNSGGTFVAVNCASLPENLIESELFGYRAGAFTGAARSCRRTAARSSSTKSATCRWRCRRGSCACWRSTRSRRSARKPPSRSISSSSARATATCSNSCRRACSARISITG